MASEQKITTPLGHIRGLYYPLLSRMLQKIKRLHLNQLVFFPVVFFTVRVFFLLPKRPESRIHLEILHHNRPTSCFWGNGSAVVLSADGKKHHTEAKHIFVVLYQTCFGWVSSRYFTTIHSRDLPSLGSHRVAVPLHWMCLLWFRSAPNSLKDLDVKRWRMEDVL